MTFGMVLVILSLLGKNFSGLDVLEKLEVFLFLIVR